MVKSDSQDQPCEPPTVGHARLRSCMLQSPSYHLLAASLQDHLALLITVSAVDYADSLQHVYCLLQSFMFRHAVSWPLQCLWAWGSLF